MSCTSMCRRAIADCLCGQPTTAVVLVACWQALELEPNNVGLHSNLALLVCSSGQLRRADETLLRALSLDPVRALVPRASLVLHPLRSPLLL